MYLETFLADFAVFRGNTRISRVRDCAKYQKPCEILFYPIRILKEILLGSCTILSGSCKRYC